MPIVAEPPQPMWACQNPTCQFRWPKESTDYRLKISRISASGRMVPGSVGGNYVDGVQLGRYLGRISSKVRSARERRSSKV
jgi:hypothetical protein